MGNKVKFIGLSMNFVRNKNMRLSSKAKLVTSKGGIEVRRIGDPLFLWTKI